MQMADKFPGTLDERGAIAYFKIAAGLPVWAGFSTRKGGHSTGAYAGANMAFHVGDRPEAVAANRRLLAQAATGRVADFYTATQVHGCRCLEVKDSLSPAALACMEADALMTAVPGLLLGILTADCLPVVIIDRRCRAVAVAHAGWRGLLAAVVPATIAALRQGYGVEAGDLRVYCGPGIGRCCYRVGKEVVVRFAASSPFRGHDSWYERRPDGYYLDLPRLLWLQLRAVGLPAAAISLLRTCTACNSFFFSYRRDHGITGRQIAFAGLDAGAGDGHISAESRLRCLS